MEDISLHILDIVENSIRADARIVEIILTRDGEHDLLRVEINDDGKGMDPETLSKVRDPFFTTKGKKTGLGIPLLAQAAEQAGGKLTLDSAPGKGTQMSVAFRWSHVDRPAIGSMTDTLMALIAGHPDRDFVYEERDGDRVFRFDTREIKDDLDGVPIAAPAALDAIRDLLKENIQQFE
ncbi:MAG TPA: ATP-binding protein [Nitrospirota bacterium]|nr:ATP-binding protein [Nitrospirota bacterium]